jgi:hypothetical protein
MIRPGLSSTDPGRALRINDSNGINVFRQDGLEPSNGQEVFVKGQEALNDRVDAPGQDHMSRYSIHTTTTTISISIVVFVGGVLSFAPQQREGDSRRERIKIGVGVGKDHFAGFSMMLFLWLTFFVLWR